MGVYSLDKASPKKANAGFHRGGFGDLKRKLTNRRYLCLWVLVALVPCYMLRQMFFYQSPAREQRNQVDELSLRSSSGQSSSVNVMPYAKPTEVKIPKEKSSDVKQSSTIKPAKYDSKSPPSKDDMTINPLKLKLKDNFEDNEDFGVPEDNDKPEEQLWKAPPTSSSR